MRHRPAISRALPGQRCAGFSLIELLVVISIIALLASMLLSTVVLVRRAALTQNCANNQRQLAVGFLAYAVDAGELPTCYDPSWSLAWNWGDEGCGYIESPRGPSGGTGFVHWPDGSNAPPATFDTPFSLALDGDYVTSTIKGCQKRRPPYGVAWFPWYMSNAYVYNGPSAQAAAIGNNSNRSGLFTLGGYRFDGSVHGFSVSRSNAISASRIALFVCPGISSADQVHVGEPHGTERWSSGGQDDWGGADYFSTPFNRNVTFGDGHVKHIVGPREILKDR